MIHIYFTVQQQIFIVNRQDHVILATWSLLFWDGFFKDFSKKNAVYRVLWALFNLQSWFYYVYTLYSHPSCDTSSVLDSSHFIFHSPFRFLLSVGQPLIFFLLIYIYCTEILRLHVLWVIDFILDYVLYLFSIRITLYVS